jgi:hypothetical protein
MHVYLCRMILCLGSVCFISDHSPAASLLISTFAQLNGVDKSSLSSDVEWTEDGVFNQNRFCILDCRMYILESTLHNLDSRF